MDASKCIKLLEKAGDDNIKRILEQATLTGVINKIKSLGEDVDSQRILCQRLDNISKEYERGWSSKFEGGNKLGFFRTVRGVEEIVEVDLTKIQSSLIEGLENFSSKFKDIFSGIPMLVKKESIVELDGPTSLISEIIRMGEKGISLQRYKGLGEMNADQLWETTLDPEARTLLRVKVDRDRTTEADDLFTCLMGEVVEPRKNFIQEHALSVKNLDF
jgi:DNA gyrase subunit B